MKSSNRKAIPDRIVRIILLILLAISAGCRKEPPPIKIGFVGNLTEDKSAAVAVIIRNGALLAVDDINAEGGIHGRKIELIEKDDRLDPETAVAVDRELIREDVAAIVGHVRSNMSLAVLSTINREKKVMVSPISASDKLSGIDDYFFKINPSTKKTSIMTAAYAYDIGIKEMLVLYDLTADSYSESKFQGFKEAFETMGGHVTGITYRSETNLLFPNLVAKLVESGPDAYFIIANHYDTAMVCQHLRKHDATSPIFISPWAYHQELIQNGGTAVDGVIMVHSFKKESREPAFLAFRDKYFEKYNSTPGMWETSGYEAVYILSQALSINGDPKRLKETLIQTGHFNGLQGDIIFDRYGDNQRKPLLFIVKNGAFVEIE